MRQRLAALCFLVTSVAALCNAAERRPALSGQWEGSVQIPGYELRLVIDLAQKDQEWVGSLTAPQFGVKGAPLSGLAVNENDVEFGSRGGVTFKGHLETDGALKGEYKQGGNSAPFVLKRVGEAHVDFPELSTPISKDIQGEWQGAFQFLKMKINVILKLPNGGTPTAPAGELLVIDWGNTRMPITLWKQEGNSFFAVLGDGGWSYEGEFHKDTAEIAGNLRISFLDLPLSLRSSATNASEPATPAAHPETK
jgi:hypothetical protein